MELIRVAMKEFLFIIIYYIAVFDLKIKKFRYYKKKIYINIRKSNHKESTINS